MSLGPPREGYCDRHRLHRLPCSLCARSDEDPVSPELRADCDCGHGYLDHAMRVVKGVYTGGLECRTKACVCRGFDNQAVRELRAAKAKEGAP